MLVAWMPGQGTEPGWCGHMGIGTRLSHDIRKQLQILFLGMGQGHVRYFSWEHHKALGDGQHSAAGALPVPPQCRRQGDGNSRSQ